MNSDQLVEKMKQMRLFGMTRAFMSTLQTNGYNDFTADELMSFLLEAEWDDRHSRKIERSIKLARFRYQACIEDIRYDPSRNLDKNHIMRYASCEFIKHAENIIITGATGVGKSYIASAIGHQACLKGYKIAYFNMTKLMAKLKMLKVDGSYLKEINRLEKQDLLILDDFGIQPLENQTRLDFLELIEDRHQRRSTIITSQLPVEKWYEIISDKTIADAILDRLVHSSHRIELQGESLRRKKDIEK